MVAQQNDNGDGLSLETSYTFNPCDSTIAVYLNTCYDDPSPIGKLLGVRPIVDVWALPLNRIKIYLNYCQSPEIVACHDTVITLPKLTPNKYKVFVDVETQNICFGGWAAYESDTLTIDYSYPKEIDLLPEIDTLCSEQHADFISLNVDKSFIRYQWNTGERSPSIQVDDVGIYKISVTDTNGCNYTDSILIVDNCIPGLYAPNSFTPNGDGINDIFKIYGEAIEVIELLIYNRWGELVFIAESNRHFQK